MTSSEPPTTDPPPSRFSQPVPRASTSNAPVNALRGPAVQVDVTRVTRFITIGSVVVLAVLVVVLFVAAVNKNSKNTLLQREGVPVSVTVTHCVGNLSGSGSTVSGYTCRGTFSLHGHQYDDVIGGLLRLTPAGSTVRGVIDPSDPSILGWFPAVRETQSSVSSFVAPAILLGLLLVIVPLIVWRARRRGAKTPELL
jgi:hypothetical protein